MKIVFMGTPVFAVPVLEMLVEGGHEILAVVTQPDKPKGRGKSVQFTPVKELALEYGITVYQPEKVRENTFFEVLKQLAPDAIVVAAFGQILSKRILDLPKYGCINVHASLLPRLRGAAPIQWSVIDGDQKSGITIMQMNEGIDTGDILLQEEILLDKKETGGSLFARLAKISGPLLLHALELARKGELKPMKQEESGATYSKMLDKELGKLDFTQPADVLERLIRGLNPWPSAYTFLEGKTLKIWDADVTEGKQGAKPGEVIKADKKSFTIQTGDGALKVQELQLEGKKRMRCDAFLRGCPIQCGMMFQ